MFGTNFQKLLSSLYSIGVKDPLAQDVSAGIFDFSKRL